MPRTPEPLTDARRELCAAYWPLAIKIARRQLARPGEWVDGDELRSLAGWIAVLAAARWRPEGGRSYPGYLRERLARLRAETGKYVATRRRGWVDTVDVAEVMDRERSDRP